MRVGFIGLGSQGGPMARRIVEGGFETTLWARRDASLEPYADTAAKSAGTPAELAAASDLVCLCVVGDDDVREVLYGETGVLAGLASGGIVAIHSTVHPDTCREIAEKAAAQGVSVIDAPVSGGGPPSRKASCWSWSAATRTSSTGAVRCSRPTPTRSCTSAHSAAVRSPRS